MTTTSTSKQLAVKDFNLEDFIGNRMVDECLEEISLNEEGLKASIDLEERKYYQDEINYWVSQLKTFIPC